MAEYKLGKVYTFLDRDEAKDFTGKRGFFEGNYGIINDGEYLIKNKTLGILQKVDYDSDTLPFERNDANYFQFFRPILEEKPERMTIVELIEWITRGNGLFTTDYKEGVKSDDYWWAVNIAGTSDINLDKEVDECYRIRHFGTDEILIPTKEIFLKDCRGENDDRT